MKLSLVALVIGASRSSAFVIAPTKQQKSITTCAPLRMVHTASMPVFTADADSTLLQRGVECAEDFDECNLEEIELLKKELEAENKLVKKGILFEEEGKAIIERALGLEQELKMLHKAMHQNTFITATRDGNPEWYADYIQSYHW